MTPEDFTILLADAPVRRVFCAAALGSRALADIRAASGLDTPEAAEAIGRLADCGLLVPDGPGRLTLDEGLLAAAAAAAVQQDEDRLAAEQPDPRLRGFVRGGTLLALPEQRDALRDVLWHVALSSLEDEEDEEYDERTVTDRLKPWCGDGPVDAVSLRRHLVDEGVLHRESGRYRLADQADVRRRRGSGSGVGPPGPAVD
jgi:hypothetical protein